MTDKPTKRKPETSQQMHAAIKAIIEKRSVEVSQSQYDMKVCVGAVGAARDIFESVPVEGTAAVYGQAVAAALSKLRDTYNDPDGEFTSGKAPIGDVYYDVSRLLDDQTSPEIE